MIAYYKLIKDIKTHLLADENVNTVVVGSLDEVDINKQTIFPLTHILVGSASFQSGGMVQFNITVSCMDIVDVVKEDLPRDDQQWKGLDNKQDILNSMLTVIERLEKSLRQGALSLEGYEVTANSLEPFEDRFDNLLAGWSCTFDISTYNSVQNC